MILAKEIAADGGRRYIYFAGSDRVMFKAGRRSIENPVFHWRHRGLLLEFKRERFDNMECRCAENLRCEDLRRNGKTYYFMET